MYLPRHFRLDDINAQHQLIRHYPFATLVTSSPTGLDANLLPLLLNSHREEHGVLEGHIARANPLWRQSPTQAMALFHGPQTYITPSWYPDKREHGRVVPTWHYLVVQAHGTLRFIEDTDWLHAHVNTLTMHLESERHAPWQVKDAPADYVDGMCRAIVGVEIRIERLVGKHKAAQHKDDATQQSVRCALEEEGMDEREAGWLSGAPFTGRI